jgi:hypothetical protein
MKVSPEFIADLKYLAWYYEWTQNVKDHVKRAVAESPREFIHFLASLAEAHRRGYNESNGRGLAVWCAQNGVAHPYVGELEETED